MKKVLSILVLALVAVQLAFAGDVITRDAKQLPLTARNFINRYFTDPQISHIKIEAGILGSKSYEVLLTDRTEIDFDSNGNWTDVDCKKAAVPEALIPVSVKEYVKTNFPQEVITKIIVLPNIRQVVEHWLLRHPEHADNPERSLVLAKSDGARCRVNVKT